MVGEEDARGRKAFPSRLIIFILVCLGLFWSLTFVAVERGAAVLGPGGDYTESNGDNIEICSDAACTTHTTAFAAGSRIYLRVTTTRPRNANGGSYLRLYNYLNTQVAAATWTQTSGTSPYVYTSSIVVPNPSTQYLKIAGNIVQGGNTLNFEEQIQLTTLTTQYMKFFSDAARTDESYTFRAGATIYVSAYGSGTAYSAANTGTNNRMYNFANTAVNTWAAPAVTRAGNLYTFSLTMPAAGVLTDGDWYDVRTYLRDTGAATIERMSEMIRYDNSAPTASITSPTSGQYVSGNVAVSGTADDAYTLNNWVLEYGAGAAPASWTTIGSTSTTPVNAGLLQNWDTSSLADGVYTLRLTVTDRAYNPGGVATVQVNVDNTTPNISSVTASQVHATTATVSWNTDEPADSQVEYGTAPGSYLYSTTLDPAMVTAHSQSLTGLRPSTTYYYRVASSDPAGHTGYSAEQSFSTPNQLVYQPYPAVTRDTTFNTANPGWNYGKDAFLRAGDLAGSYDTARSTLRFDLSGVPAGATVTSANMSLYQMAQADTSTPSLAAHYMTQDWTEGTGTGSATGDGADWQSYDGTNAWSTPGGDYNATPVVTVNAPNSTGSWVDFDITSAAQGWVSGTIPNYGVIVKKAAENPAAGDLKRFYSADYSDDPSLRPKLTIEWTGTDITPPNIGEVRAENITLDSADIAWSSDESGDSQVEFGTTTGYGSTTPLDSNLVNQHLVSLTGLSPDTIYHYRVITSDSSGNQTVSGDYVFQTAAQIVIDPSLSLDDTTLSSRDPDWNYGAYETLMVGERWGNSYNSLLRFDLSAIPQGSIVNSATLSLYQYAQNSTATPQIGVYNMTQSWTEGTGSGSPTGDGATWNTFDGVTNWATPGGDFDPTPEATANAPNSTGAWVDFAVQGLTQQWVDGTAPNNGVIVQKTSGAGSNDYKSFHSSEYSVDPSLRPKLVIQYVPAPGTITMSVSETYNRDGTAGGGSVGFGSVAPGTDYYVGDTLLPQYAVRLSIKSNASWGLKVEASDDLRHSNPANFIDISNLWWKNDADLPEAYQSMVKTPASTVIASNLPADNLMSFYFDYCLTVPQLAIPGSYSTSIVYTAYTE